MNTFNVSVIPFWGVLTCVGYLIGQSTGAVVGLGAGMLVSFLIGLVSE